MPYDFQIQLDDENVLRCTRYPAIHEPKSLILIAHGYKGFKDWGMFPYVAESLCLHHEVVTFNFSHNGIGEDPLQFTELDKFAVNTYDREQQDLGALISWLQQEESLRSLPLFLIGHSRGAGTCLVYALDHPNTCAGILSWNGVTNLDLFTPQQKEEMLDHGRSYELNKRTNQRMPLDVVILKDLEEQSERYDILGRMADSSIPVALFQGTKDGQRLREGSAKLVQIRPDVSWIQIEGGNHTFNTAHPFTGTTPQLEQALAASLGFIEDQITRR